MRQIKIIMDPPLRYAKQVVGGGITKSVSVPSSTQLLNIERELDYLRRSCLFPRLLLNEGQTIRERDYLPVILGLTPYLSSKPLKVVNETAPDDPGSPICDPHLRLNGCEIFC